MQNLQEQYNELNDWDRVEFLRKIEFEDDPSKWELLDHIIQDEEDYDLARIEALKILEIAEIQGHIKDKIMKTLIGVIESTEDYDVRNYATSAIVNFVEYSQIRIVARNLVLNIDEDIDIRYNAFDVIKKISDIDERNEVLKRLLDDTDFQKSAQRVLTEGS
ncbi:hypothetical protein [Chryseobacterium sediminis]|uniref:HEAT repeat domain-containing protein n=1 Tax=Chryseobacterium sediminis TaxID=1679494 RepID=A0A5B2U8A6_9FLAO|nr:hypothetical protein [Chryseobacterium sediminis]KAA2222663.1 hypothetical protein FW780_00250 [Chryseobacterium sediminis]